MLIYYLGVCVYCLEPKHPLIKVINNLAELYEVFNSKKEKLKFIDLNKLLNNIKSVNNALRENVTIKLHSLIHYLSQTVKFGLFWNYNSFIFESYFNNLKKVARNCGKNPMWAIENYVRESYISNLFALPASFLLNLGASKVEVDFLKQNEDNNTERLSYIFFYRLKFVKNSVLYSKNVRSFGRYYIDGHQITIEKYSKTKKTNNHYAILNINNQVEYVKLIAIEQENIYFKIAYVVEELFKNNFVKTTFNETINVAHLNTFQKKVFALETPNFCFFKIN